MTRFERRQQLARESGVCIVCHRQSPPSGRTVCAGCNEKAKVRVFRARRAARARVSSELEQSADQAAQRAVPLLAAQTYEAAFYAADDDATRARICEKIGNVYFGSDEPLLARDWLQRAAALYETLNDIPGVVRAWLRLARQSWVEGEASKIRVIVDRMATLVSRDGHLPSYLRVHAYRALQTATIDECERADTMLVALEPDLAAGDLETQALVQRTRAMIAAVRGDVEECFAQCDAAIATAEAIPSGYLIGTYLHEKAHRALALGYTDVALAARARAVLVARQFAIGWSIRDHTTEYAYLLHQLGQSRRAADLMREAADSSESTPNLRICVAAFGIPVALATGDEALLRATLLEDTIELAFATTEPYCIIRVARAFAEWYYRNGRVAEAEVLLRRALRYVAYPEYAWDLLVFVLVHCRDASIRATALDSALERGRPARRRTPAMSAMRQLCIALTARDGRRAVAAAQAALPVLRDVRWAAYVRIAEDVLRRYDTPAVSAPPAAVEEAARMLTPRERQVTELALRGLTNRTIAAQLRISERTVESHMTSILARLGLRSRWQIATTLGSAAKP